MPSPSHPQVKAPSPRRSVGEALRRGRATVLLTTLIIGLLGLLAWAVQPDRWQAEARLFVAEALAMAAGADEAVRVPDFARHVQRQAEFAVSPSVLRHAGNEVGVDAGTLQEQVTAQALPRVGIVVIRAEAGDTQTAVAWADAVADAAVSLAPVQTRADVDAAVAGLEEGLARLRAQLLEVNEALAADPDDPELQAERDTLVAQVATVQSRVDAVALDTDADTVVVERLDGAEPSPAPSRSIPWYTPVLGALGGLLAGSAWVIARRGRIRVAELREQPGMVLGAPLLGEIPDFAAAGVQGPDPTRTAPNSAPAEAYQFVVQALEYVLGDQRPGTVLVTSPGAAAGKSVTALNLAIAAAQDGRRVILVDADERVRGLTRSQPVNAEPGLTNLADAAVPFDGCVAALHLTDRWTLPLVPAGSRLADPAGFFRTPGFATAMARIRSHADMVIVDSPPFMAVSDTSAIAKHCDGIVLVVAQDTPLRLLEDVRERLDLVSTPVIGYVFNRSRPRRKSTDYDRFGYTYGYGYGHEQAKQGLVTLEHLPERVVE